jgi:hypothetical protein
MKQLTKILKTILPILVALILVNIMAFDSKKNIRIVEKEVVREFDTTEYVKSIKDSFKLNLVSEVENYINKIAPTSKLNPELLVEKCLEYNTDLVFVLSQALLESHFGTKGKATQTNSVWNVGTYDNGKVLYTYKDPNNSLVPYLKLINEKYLINVSENGDTTYKDLSHLLEDKGYINYNGDRFASARGYENGLRKIMIKIDLETKISFYQQLISLSSDDLVAYFVPITKNPNKKKYVMLN